MFHVPETARVDGSAARLPNSGNAGAFLIIGPMGRHLACIATTDISAAGEKWEHVSVSLPDRPAQTPTWDEMDHVKGIFWDPQDAVIQYHPPEAAKINFHVGCLHLWRPLHCGIPLPDHGIIEPGEL